MCEANYFKRNSKSGLFFPPKKSHPCKLFLLRGGVSHGGFRHGREDPCVEDFTKTTKVNPWPISDRRQGRRAIINEVQRPI